MKFENILSMLKEGKKACRSGWNGKGMFVVLQKGYPNGISCNKQTADAWGLTEGDEFKLNPYFQIKNVNGTYSMWVPSTGDLLAEDWEVIEDGKSYVDLPIPKPVVEDDKFIEYEFILIREAISRYITIISNTYYCSSMECAQKMPFINSILNKIEEHLRQL